MIVHAKCLNKVGLPYETLAEGQHRNFLYTTGFISL